MRVLSWISCDIFQCFGEVGCKWATTELVLRLESTFQHLQAPLFASLVASTLKTHLGSMILRVTSECYTCLSAWGRTAGNIGRFLIRIIIRCAIHSNIMFSPEELTTHFWPSLWWQSSCSCSTVKTASIKEVQQVIFNHSTILFCYFEQQKQSFLSSCSFWTHTFGGFLAYGSPLVSPVVWLYGAAKCHPTMLLYLKVSLPVS